ncbi:MAG: UDP-N-acetylmuramoyl-L-alanyl-D-glutamate--2,6-diaminopimelate ligase [Desulfobulbus propionicus]|nr:MAG: UDP-N-acetylmuramoyl-L-alanyl-D-glutamate--2,6-diaminopimelate ligase [Desulfobulbus propionicus]
MRTLSSLILALERHQHVVVESGNDLSVSSIAGSTDQVGKGSLFVAMKGRRCDGYDFVDEAVARGCGALVVPRKQGAALAARISDVPIIMVDDTRAAYAVLASAWYGNPSEEVVMIGVTGTNGKTTCTWLLEKVLKNAGCRPGVLGTINYRYFDGEQTCLIGDAPLTTPEPLVLQQHLRRMVDAGTDHIIMEVSSHALDQRRIDPILFDVAIFTNLSRDHLDYHRDYEHYFFSKKRLFLNHLKKNGKAVLMMETAAGKSEWASRLAQELDPGQIIRCGFEEENDLTAREVHQDAEGTRATLFAGRDEIPFYSPLTGRFNVLNILASAGAAWALMISPEVIANGLSQVGSVPGRLERVSLEPQYSANDPAVFVDYAHTPDALENVLLAVKEICPGRIICVFGCGGDRDRGKRPEMGRIAGLNADVTIITSDNPRSEEPGVIISEIVSGMESTGAMPLTVEEALVWNGPEKRYVVLQDRQSAIALACHMGSQGDWVLIAGKGHETCQIVKEKRCHLDDHEEAVNGLLKWNVSSLLEATGGQLLSGQQRVLLGEVSTDTRVLQPGDIFFALRGEKYDGHDFMETAFAKGAGAVIVERAEAAQDNVPVIQVHDTHKALGALARYRRKKLGKRLRVVAITGSSGKTTVKEMTAAIFSEHYGDRRAVIKTPGNLNNQIGLPLSLLPVSACHKVAILEMGMNSFGEIAALTDIADPDTGCINNVHPAHLSGLGSVEGVARAKGELFAGMSPAAVRVVNLDDAQIRKLAVKYGGTQVGFALSAEGREYLPEVQVNNSVSLGEQGSTFQLSMEKRQSDVRLRAAGRHNISNSAAAAAIARAAGVPLKTIIAGIEHYQPIDKRMMVTVLPGGIKVMNDTYNANPASMKAALETVASFGTDCTRIAALGDMFELGEAARSAHVQVGTTAAEAGFSMLAVTGSHAEEVALGARRAGMSAEKVYTFVDPPAIALWLSCLIADGVVKKDDWVLVKGSRGMQMETMITALEKLLQQ